ncbi:MAG: PIN domain-containing protein [bacterium]|nr:PIN domain-containing protein [bacterium]
MPSGLRGCRGAVLDTMLLIYLLENHAKYGGVCEWLFQQAEAGEYTGVITPVTMAEIVVKPLQCGRHDIADSYQTAICNAPNMCICDFSWKTGVMAGALRAKYNLLLPDMFQVASAMEHGGVLISNDRVLRKIMEIRIILLDDLV